MVILQCEAKFKTLKSNNSRAFPGGPGEGIHPAMQEIQVEYLFRELRSHMLQSS